MSPEYTPITKLVVNENSENEIQCIGFDTPKCVIHNGIPDCTHCPIYQAMMLRLYSLENFYESVAQPE